MPALPVDARPMPLPDAEPVVTLSVPLFLALLHLIAARARKPQTRREPSKYRLLRHRKILGVLNSTTPHTAKEISWACGLKLDGQLRADLSELKRQGRICRRRGDWGYLIVPCVNDQSAQPKENEHVDQ